MLRGSVSALQTPLHQTPPGVAPQNNLLSWGLFRPGLVPTVSASLCVSLVIGAGGEGAVEPRACALCGKRGARFLCSGPWTSSRPGKRHHKLLVAAIPGHGLARRDSELGGQLCHHRGTISCSLSRWNPRSCPAAVVSEPVAPVPYACLSPGPCQPCLHGGGASGCLCLLRVR